MSAGLSATDSCSKRGTRPSHDGVTSIWWPRSRRQPKDRRIGVSLQASWRSYLEAATGEDEPGAGNSFPKLGIHSRNELIEEMATEMGLNRMGEDDTTRMMMMEMLLTALLLPPLRLLSKRKKIRRC
jgi:hypothetical protein